MQSFKLEYVEEVRIKKIMERAGNIFLLKAVH